MADIFLSYARADQPKIERLAAALEEAGYSVWWDKHIRGGAEFSRDIEAALHAAKAVIVAWSEHGAESEWVREEATFARDHHKLIPVRLDDNLPPFGYRQRQAIDLSAGLTNTDSLESLTKAIDDLIGADAHHHIEPQEPTENIRRRPALIGAIAGITLVAGLGGWWVLGGPDDPAEFTMATKAEDARSVAVLPFNIVSPNADDRYLADGLAIQLLDRLDALRELKVAPRTASFRFRQSEKALDAIAADLAVDHLVEGDVVRIGDDFRITARLIHAADGVSLWTSSYDASVDGLTSAQATIAEEVAAALDVLLDDAKRRRMADAGTDDPLAFAELTRLDEQHREAHQRGEGIGPIYDVSVQYADLFDRKPELWPAAVSAADAYTHIMLASAGGRQAGGRAAEVWDRAPAIYDGLLVDARNAARRERDRASIEHGRIIFSDDWSRLVDNARVMFSAADDCSTPTYLQFVMGFGIERLAYDYLKAKRHCFAGEPQMVLDLAALGFALGEHAEVVAMVEELVEVGTAPPPVLDGVRLQHAMFDRRTDDVRTIIGQQGDGPAQQMYIALMTGDRANVEQFGTEPIRQIFGTSSDYLAALARAGFQKEIERLARDIDARTGGPTALHLAHTQCNCGPLFDLAITPNYAARLAEAGFRAPFPSGVHYPLKDW